MRSLWLKPRVKIKYSLLPAKKLEKVHINELSWGVSSPKCHSRTALERKSLTPSFCPDNLGHQTIVSRIRVKEFESSSLTLYHLFWPELIKKKFRLKYPNAGQKKS